MMPGEALKKIDSVDGKRYAELLKRDGFFYFQEYSEETDSGYVFMSPSHCSGLYATLVEAEKDMIASLPWLRESEVR